VAKLNELIALNDEVSALARAGLPVDLGLGVTQREIEDQLSRINRLVARRMSRGEDLAAALADDESIPVRYRQVLQAGIRAGRLPAALEALARYSQTVIDVRGSIRSALAYPFCVCVLAYVLFVGYCMVPVQVFAGTLRSIYANPGPVVRGLGVIRDWLPVWIAVPPAILGVLLVCSRTARRSPRAGHLPRWCRWLPGVARIERDQHWASLSDVLAALVANGVPPGEGLRLAAGVAGNRELAAAADGLGAGQTDNEPVPTSAERDELPPLVRWALSSSDSPASVAESLRLAADTYRHRAQQRLNWLRILLPVITCVVLAGGVTLAFGLSVFLPIVEILLNLA
jgi:type II secretory pathway component PulF